MFRHYGKNAWKVRVINISMYAALLGVVGCGSYFGYTKLQLVYQEYKVKKEKEQEESFQESLSKEEYEESFMEERTTESSVENEPATLIVSNQIESTIAETELVETTEEEKIHHYEYYIADVTWEEAQYSCFKKGGHLVTFDSEEEFSFVLDQIIDKGYDNIKFYIGAKREPDEKEYRWMNEDEGYYGEVINESNHWLNGEPSFYDAELEANQGIRVDECCVNMFYYQDEARWVWNDIPNDLLGAASYYSGKIGFICEYDD